MSKSINRALGMFDPVTGLPRAVVDKPPPEELIDEHFVYKNTVMDYSEGLLIDETKYKIDIDIDEDDDDD